MRHTRRVQTTAHRQNPAHPSFYQNLWAKNSVYIFKWLGERGCFRNYMTHENIIKLKCQHPVFLFCLTLLLEVWSPHSFPEAQPRSFICTAYSCFHSRTRHWVWQQFSYGHWAPLQLNGEVITWHLKGHILLYCNIYFFLILTSAYLDYQNKKSEL